MEVHCHITEVGCQSSLLLHKFKRQQTKDKLAI